jgi:hypothetical protein
MASSADVKSRAPADEILRGLETTSDKIRALARAGYLRTEIREILDIRYQHVRKVLVDAGITGGLQRPIEMERSIDVIEVQPAERVQTSPSVLLAAGFQPLGVWQIVDDKLELSARAPVEAGVYAFILDDVVVYVGVTQNGLQTRMDQYRRGHAGQRTSARVNALIRKAVEAGQKVAVMTVIPPLLDWKGLPIDGAAGLEAGLIRQVQPLWNMRGLS